jgi:hypothetical protein
MLSRRIHRYIGLVLLFPIIGWALTGLVFLIKPGYDSAYEVITIKTYPLDQKLNIAANENWEEVRVIKSVLGSHLLVTTEGKTNHLDFNTLKQEPMPSVIEVTRLVEDAIADNKERYGSVLTVDGTTAYTTTGVEVTVNWDELKLNQIGSDRHFIDWLYKVHYLQWTPWRLANYVLGIVGLLLLVTLTAIGLRLYLKNTE